MKVGGNAAAAEFFRQHGAGKDAKAKYTSRAATMYKERLKKLADEDARRYPNRIVVDGEGEENGNAVAKNNDDFFSSWDKPTAAPTISAPKPEPAPVPAPAPIYVSKPTNVTAPAPAPAPSRAAPATIAVETAAAAALFTDNAVTTPVSLASTRSNSGANILKPVKKGLGAKKATKIVNFEEAERLAKEAEEKRKREEEKERQRRAEEERQRLAQPIIPVATATSSQAAKTAPKISAEEAAMMERLGMGMGKLGFGATGGFGSTPTSSCGMKLGSTSSYSSNTSDSDEAQKRFGTAKAISSDQYFGRGNFDEAASREAQTRLQQFSGRSGFGSAEYYGRDETVEFSRDANDPMGMLGESARDFAQKFVGQAKDDVAALKRLVAEGGNKLGDMLQDMSVSVVMCRSMFEVLCVDWAAARVLVSVVEVLT